MKIKTEIDCTNFWPYDEDNLEIQLTSFIKEEIESQIKTAVRFQLKNDIMYQRLLKQVKKKAVKDALASLNIKLEV